MDYTIYAVIVIIVFAVIIIRIFTAKSSGPATAAKDKPDYVYTRKQFIMTKAENDFYKSLQAAIGTSYIIYPQAHLDSFLDHKVKGQDWRAALSGIQRKSVDFLICSREYYNPLVAIELDDASHDCADRVERDAKLEAICQVANMPLVRVKWQSQYNVDELLRLLSPRLR